MKPRDYALEIDPGADASRIDAIERVLHKFAHDLFRDEAIDIDDKSMNHQMSYSWEAARQLRDKAHEHLNQT